jgi:spore germination cell wall hydrolase CwlJ-like protein
MTVIIARVVKPGRVIPAARHLLKRGVAALFGAGSVVGLVVGIITLTDEPSSAVTLQMPQAKAAALVSATSGTAASEMEAIGQQAKLINAALPFADGPLRAARPFSVTGTDTDQRRALLCLTQAVYYEAGFEPVEGRRAVAQVVLNRMRHPAFPKSICGVVYQGSGSGVCQFTFVCDGAIYRKPASYAWAQAEAVARAALGGYVDQEVGVATHYHADYVTPRWAPLLAKVAKVGQHIFYRWPGAWGQPAAFSGRYIGEPRDPLSLRAPMPQETRTAAEGIVAIADASPPVPRAVNDVGGLLDPSKGWTLHIPGPEESSGAAARLVAAQSAKPAGSLQVASAQSGAPAGSR